MPISLLQRHALVLAGALLLADAAASAQDEKRLSQFVLETWQAQQGLAQSTIEGIERTSDGLLWLATHEGLVSYDGYRFRTLSSATTDGLKANTIYALKEDQAGRLWIGTGGGGLSLLENGEVRNFDESDGLPGDTISDIELAPGGMWIATNQGLCWWRDFRCVEAPFDPAVADATVRHLFLDQTGALWIGTLDGLIHFHDGQSRRLELPAGSSSIRAITQTPDGDLWFGTAQGVLRWDGRSFHKYTTHDGLADDLIQDVVVDSAGSLWVASNSGLSRWNRTKFDSLTSANGLTSDFLLSLYPDTNGMLWIGTAGGGLNRLANGVVTAWDRQEGLPHNIAWTLLEDRQGVIWVGTNGGLATLQGGSVTASYSVEDGLAHNVVTSLLETRDGALLVGTAGGLSIRRDQQFRAWESNDRIKSKLILALHQSADGTIWVGTERGLHLIRPDGAVESRYAPKDMPADSVRVMLEEAGVTWLGTNGGGVVRYQDGRYSSVPEATRACNEQVLSLHRLDQRRLLVGTDGGGLCALDEDGRGNRLAAAPGFLGAVNAMVRDAQGNLWMSAENGIYQMSVAALAASLASGKPLDVFRKLDTFDGMKSGHTSGGVQPAALRASDGSLWFPTIRGIARVVPGDEVALRPQLRPLIERLEADGASLRAPFEVRSGTDALTIQYTAPALSNARSIAFRYRLNADEKWIDAADSRALSIAKPRSGDYRFEVQARFPGEQWSEETAALSFSVEPAVYETGWFLVVALLGLFLLALGAHRIYLRIVGARETELRALVDERTGELQRAISKLEILSAMDPMTHVPNRRRLEALLQLEWQRAYRANACLTVLMIDVDHFKLYNDALGHQAGDQCLIAISAALEQELRRAGDWIGRYGGEEFLAILSSNDAAGAMVVAERIRQRVCALNLPHPDSPTAAIVTISIGAATGIPGPHTPKDEFVKIADEALYQAKAQGRNRAVHRTMTEPATPDSAAE